MIRQGETQSKVNFRLLFLLSLASWLMSQQCHVASGTLPFWVILIIVYWTITDLVQPPLKAVQSPRDLSEGHILAALNNVVSPQKRCHPESYWASNGPLDYYPCCQLLQAMFCVRQGQCVFVVEGAKKWTTHLCQRERERTSMRQHNFSLQNYCIGL